MPSVKFAWLNGKGVLMGPNRPYLLRAFFEWLLDNDCTPHLVVNATLAGVKVPLEHIKDGQIVLNIAPHSVGNFDMNNERVTFNARFGGKPFQIIVPMAAVVAIYARENGAGTMFEDEEFYQQPQELSDSSVEGLTSTIDDDVVDTPTPKDRSFLKVIK